MKKVAVISAVLEDVQDCQHEFNKVVAQYKEIVRGRMGVPFFEEGITVISITVVGNVDDINSLTGKLGNIPNVSVKTAIGKKEIL